MAEIAASQDAFLSSAQPNTNFGGSTSLKLGYNASLGAMRILIQFDLGVIPQNAIINNASFQIYESGASPAGDAPMSFTAQFVEVGWNEGQVTWNNATFLGGASLPLGQLSSATGWQSGDATTAVFAWHNGTHPNFGVIVTGDETAERNRSRDLYSKEQPGLYPRLVVDYTVTCDTVPPTAAVNSLPPYSPGTFTVSWPGSDAAPPGCDPSGIAFNDVQYRINGGGWVDWQRQTPATSGTFNFAGNGGFVELRARAEDRAGNVQPFGGPQASTLVDTQAPAATVNALPEFTTSSSFVVTWGGTDNLSGIESYDVQVQIGGGTWETLAQQTTQTSYQVTGAQTGQVYAFRARARDAAGNVQPWNDGYQTATTVFATPIATVQQFNPTILKPTAPITASFTVNWTGYFAPGTAITSYSIFYNWKGQGWQLWTTFPGAQTSATFNWSSMGLGDGVYEFEAVAVNNLGQTEPQKFKAEAIIIVDMANRYQPRLYLPFIAR